MDKFGKPIPIAVFSRMRGVLADLWKDSLTEDEELRTIGYKLDDNRGVLFSNGETW